MVFNFKVFKKCSPNGKLTLYMGKRDFVDHISYVEPIGQLQNYGIDKDTLCCSNFADYIVLLVEVIGLNIDRRVKNRNLKVYSQIIIAESKENIKQRFNFF